MFNWLFVFVCFCCFGSASLGSFGFVRFGSSSCLDLVFVQFSLVQFDLVVGWVKIVLTICLFDCLVGQTLTICLFGESNSHTLVVWWARVHNLVSSHTLVVWWACAHNLVSSPLMILQFGCLVSWVLTIWYLFPLLILQFGCLVSRVLTIWFLLPLLILQFGCLVNLVLTFGCFVSRMLVYWFFCMTASL